ncbi:MAG TPA: hypothetical protein VEF76_08450 [Patescibacteria group bacterium]|nr:hypothetical protein [Patescibacteria group bacterium]
MDLTAAFNSSEAEAAKATPFVLDIYYRSRGGGIYMTYDFMSRVLLTRTGNSEGGLSVTPFNQLDRETLVAARDRLVQLGGEPPELPAEAATLLKPRPLKP